MKNKINDSINSINKKIEIANKMIIKQTEQNRCS